MTATIELNECGWKYIYIFFIRNKPQQQILLATNINIF